MLFVYKNKEFTIQDIEKMMNKQRHGKKIEVFYPYEFLSFKINDVLYMAETIETIVKKDMPLKPDQDNIERFVCPYCHKKIYEIDRYCSNCGQRLYWGK